MTDATIQRNGKRVLIDLDRCIECRSCSAACFYGHARLSAINLAAGGVALLPVACRQCVSAACIDACPNEALELDDRGVVRRKPLRCTGCGSCVAACPFGVIAEAQANIPDRDPHRLNGRLILKCDVCGSIRPGGDGDVTPYCVAACPTAALVFTDPHAPVAEAGQGLALLGGRSLGEHPVKRR